jgi:ribonuclease E
MRKEMVINATIPENVRVAILKDGRLDGYFEETEDLSRTRGNIYLGRVVNIERGLEACFIEYGEARHGFLPFSEILINGQPLPAIKEHTRIDQALRRGQTLIVQVDKEPVGTKGARLTTELSLAGRYLVLMPGSDLRGVSRKIEDPEERQKYRKMGAELNPPQGMGFIIRTAGLGQTKRELSRDMGYLERLWKEIERSAQKGNQPRLLHAEATIIQRVIRDYYDAAIERIWVDTSEAFIQAETFMKIFMPRQVMNLKAYTDKAPVFDHFGIEDQIEAIHRRQVPLPSGGSLVIEQTEALVTIDVNSGKTKNRGTQEETIFETNQEAASEIARQLRLRDLAGIIVIDFIDQSSAAHNTTVERSLREGMHADKARHQIGKISTFGLCTLTRQRLGHSLRLVGYERCPTCGGDGIVRDPEGVSSRLLRRMQAEAAKGAVAVMRVRLQPPLANHVQNRHRRDLVRLEREFGMQIEIHADPVASRTNDDIELVHRLPDKPATPSPAPRSAIQPQPMPAKPHQDASKAPEGQRTLTQPRAQSDTSVSRPKRRRRRRHRPRDERQPSPVSKTERSVDLEAATMAIPQLPDIPTPFPVEETLEESGDALVHAPLESAPAVEHATKLPPQPPKRWRHRRRKKSNQSKGLNRAPNLG